MTVEIKPPPSPAKKRRKAVWTKQFYLWHWVSSAICLASMLLFAVTGITLNHAEDIPAEPKVSTKEATFSPEQLTALEGLEPEVKTPLPNSLAGFLSKEIGIPLKGKEAEWSEYEIYFELAKPGEDAWLLIDRETGEIFYERSRRGVISFLNDLHQGRNTGNVWSWYLDIFSVACVVFTLTGLVLLGIHSKRRKSTWPIVAGSFLLPVVLLLISIH